MFEKKIFEEMRLPKFFRVCREVRLISDQVGPLENKTPGVDPKLRPFLRISEMKIVYINQIYFLQVKIVPFPRYSAPRVKIILVIITSNCPNLSV